MLYRRMQANLGHVNSYHLEEHDESNMCQYHPPCRPVERKPVTNLAEAIQAIPEAGVGHNYRGYPIDAAEAYDLVRDTVGVPDTGTFIVADGVVHKAAARYVKERLRPGGRLWKWTLEAEEPRPAFFEEGKTYRRTSISGDSTFTVTHLDEHPDTKVRYAHGWRRDTYSGGGHRTFATSATDIGRWEEVR
ncbi:hypothetical protein [Streptomyces sp. S1]|uniref:hypothetical protein n=1 Tax=Streptomyces sp. S1 TaxID=718288 RepID=UPI003D71F0D3